jgi:antitoxin CcdA
MLIGTTKVYDVDAPKARFNMTLNEDLVRAVREHTDNLSDYVEKLLVSAVEEERRRKAEDERHWAEVCDSWNEFQQSRAISLMSTTAICFLTATYPDAPVRRPFEQRPHTQLGSFRAGYPK